MTAALIAPAFATSSEVPARPGHTGDDADQHLPNGNDVDDTGGSPTGH